MYCPNCGTKLEDNASVCPECGELINKKAPSFKDKMLETSKKITPIVAVELVLSLIAFIIGFIITTTFFVVGFGLAYLDFFVILPAFVGLSIGVYKAFDRSAGSGEKTCSKICIVLNAFTLFYAFVGIMVLIA